MANGESSRSKSSSVTNARHYCWGEGCEGFHLLESPELSVVQERMPSQTREIRHRHARARQYFFVLRGTLQIELEGTVHDLHAECGLEIAATLAHEVRNISPDVTEFLVISTPPTSSDRIPA